MPARSSVVCAVLVLLVFGVSGGLAATEVHEVEPAQGRVDQDNDIVIRGDGFASGSAVGMPRSRWPRLVSEVVPAGTVWGVDVAGGLVFAAGDYRDAPDGAGLRIYDFVTGPGPVRVGAVAVPGEARAVAVVGDLAYVAAGTAGLQIVDIRDPAAPTLRGRAPEPAFAWSVVVREGFAYVSGNSSYPDLRGTTWILDVADPDDPRVASRFETPGAAWAVRVDGDRMVVADGDHGVAFADVTDPYAPVPRGTLATPGTAWGLDFAEGYLFVTGVAHTPTREGFLVVADVDDPDSPTIVGLAATPGEAWSVAVRDGMAYVADHFAGIHAFDVTDPAVPRSAGRCDALGFAAMIALDGDQAYLASQSHGVHRYDLSAPSASPVLDTMATTGWSHDLAWHGDLVVLAEARGGVRVVDPRDAGTLHECGACPVLGGAYRVDADAAVAGALSQVEGRFELSRIDIADPFGPATTGSATVPAIANDVALENGRAFVAGGSMFPPFLGLLSTYDVRAGGSPALIDVRPLPVWAHAIETDGRYAWIGAAPLTASPSGWLWIVDLDAATGEPPVGALALLGSPTALAVADGLAFVGTDPGDGTAWSTLWTVDVTDPERPTILSGFPVPGTITGIAAAVGRVHVVGTGCPNGRKGMLRTIDVRDPTTPVLAGRYDLPGEAYGVLASEGLALVADGYAGMHCVRLNPAIANSQSLGADEIAATVPAGYAPGTYDVRIAGADANAEGIALYRSCLDRALETALVPVPDPASSPSDPATFLGPRVPWRLEATGDSLFFGRHPRHDAWIDVPEMPDGMIVEFVPDESGDTVLEATWSAALGVGRVVVRSDDEVRARALWDEVRTTRRVPLPRIDTGAYGDVVLAVDTREATTAMASSVRYRYRDGRLRSAAAAGPAADLVVRTEARDAYACTFADAVSYLAARRAACEAFADAHPGWVIDCES